MPIEGHVDRLIERPIVIIGAPRSGTSILFQVLSTHPELWSLYRESQPIIERTFHLREGPPASDTLTEADVDDQMCIRLQRQFLEQVGNLELLHPRLSSVIPLIARVKLSKWIGASGNGQKRPPLRMVEKTPENSFRIRLLRRLFPDALFLYVIRDPRAAIASIYRGWQQPTKFKTHPLPPGFRIDGYDGSHWSFGLPPGWRAYAGRSLIEICALQWKAYNEACLRDLPSSAGEVLRVRYEHLIANPASDLQPIAGWAGIDYAPLARFGSRLPVVNTRSKPNSNKWRVHADELALVLPGIAELAARLGYEV